MRRALILAVLLTIFSLSLSVRAYQQPPAAAGQAASVVEVEKLKDNLVDTKIPGWGQPILDKKAGKSVDDVANTWAMPAKYTGYAAAPPARLKANVQVIFDELK